MAALLRDGVLLLLLAWHQLKQFVGGHWHAFVETSLWQLATAVMCSLCGVGVLVLLYLRLEHIASRMGVTVFALVLLLTVEGRGGRRRRA